jgi:hypothetical protein
MGRGTLGEARMSRKGPEKPSGEHTPAELRRRRLAEALRANLKRRKATRPPKAAGKPDAQDTGKD